MRISPRFALAVLLLPGAAAAEPAPRRPGLDLAALDPSADKCEDFFQYACGRWIKKNPIPGDQSRWGRFNEVAERNRAILRGILEKAASGASRDATARKIGDYYAACMDRKAADKLGVQPLAPLFKEIGALDDKAALPALVGRLNAVGVGALLGFDSGQDYQDATKMIAQADQSGWSLPDRDYYIKEQFAGDRKAFQEHVANMFKLAGDPPEQAAAAAVVVMDVETGLAKAAMGRVERREPANVHHKTKLPEFAATTPDFAWKEYLAAMKAPEFAELDVNDPGFFQGMDALVASVPLSSWRTYLRWRAIHSFAGNLSSGFVDEDFAFFGRHLNGQKKIKPRWKRCVAEVDEALGEALGKAYVESQFPPSAKARTRAQIAQIEAAMKDELSSLNWLSPDTRKKALVKLAAVANKVGYPDKWRDYSKLAISRSDAVGNAQRAANFEVHRRLDKIGRPTDRGEWEMSPPTVNAYYDPQMNDINFPAGILRPPFYMAEGDDAVNYGGIGAVEGHELTHGFDDEGRHYDAQGNLKDWWTAEDAAAFDRRAQSLVEQYASYVAVKDPAGDPAKDVHVNGKLTLGENTADNGGLKLAYAAMTKNLGPDQRGSRGGFTPEQRFFLGFAQIWCTNMTVESAKVRAVSDPHSPPKYRVNGAVSNMPEFGAAFACKPGAPMNPVQRHGVW